MILHEITPHRIEQFKRHRLNGTWRAFKQKRSSKPVRPGTVNRELDTLKSILSKAVERKYLVDSPARGVKRFRLENRRTRILSPDEQRRLLEACERMPKLQALVKLALITGARIGELLDLRWEDCQDGYMTFWQTKNGRVRRAQPHHGHDRGSPRLQTANPRVGLHQRQDRKAVHHDSQSVRAGSRARKDHDRRRHGSHAAPHGVAHD